MEFRDLGLQYQYLKEKIDNAILNVCSNANFISGIEVQELEEKLADFIGMKHCITCANGTDALVLSLMAWNIGTGDAVFVPDFTFFASAEAVAFLGAVPIFVDVEMNTFNISAQSLENSIKTVIKTGKLVPKAVIAVDLFGQPANYYEIRKITKNYNLLLLEDGAQGFGGSIDKKKACSFGDISTTSFFPAKPLGCYGDGGAVFTNNDKWADIIRSLCVHGKGINKYDNIRIGMNSRLDTIQAVILEVKLKAFIEYELEDTDNAAKKYKELLNSTEKIIVPNINEGYFSSWAQYTILCDNKQYRDKIKSELEKYKIPSMIYYAKGLHEQKVFNNKYYIDDDYTNTDYLKERVLSLPIYPYIEDKQIEFICNIINTVILETGEQ